MFTDFYFPHKILDSHAVASYIGNKMFATWKFMNVQKVHIHVIALVTGIYTRLFLHAGIVLHYVFVSLSLFWLLHVTSIFYAIVFPFSARKTLSKYKHMYLIPTFIGKLRMHIYILFDILLQRISGVRIVLLMSCFCKHWGIYWRYKMQLPCHSVHQEIMWI